MINVTAIGRLGNDAQLRQAGQSQVCSFTIAVEKSKKDPQGKPLIDWYSIDIWGKRGEALCQYLRKGTRVAVAGRLEMDSFQNQSGVTVQKPTINAQDITLLGSPQQSNGQQQQQAPAQQQQQQQAPRQYAPPPAATTRQTSQQAQQELDAIFASEDEIPF